MSIVQLKERQRLRHKRRRKQTFLTIATIIFIICFVLISCGASTKQYSVEYEYKKCDALWDFVALCPEDMDSWEYIYEIMELNGMSDTTVYPNRLYMVPIYTK